MNVNALAWYSTRELSLTPPHFVRCPTPVTDKSLLWVLTKLQGRYTTIPGNEPSDEYLYIEWRQVAFEDPAEAMLYELRWSGTK